MRMNMPVIRKKWLAHAIVISIFLVIAVIYCRPAFQGKVLDQYDMAGWVGMVHQMQQFKAAHGHFPLWNNSMFGGMPAYQIALEPQNSASLDVLHPFLTLFLPAPASFFFLLCISFYFLTQVLRVNPWIGLPGALAYAYASFSPILVSAGHETQIQAMGYVPFLLGALLLVYEGRYWWGALLTGIFTSLLISRNHPQITYYFLMIAAALTLSYIIRWIRSGQFRHLALCLLLAGGAGVLGVLTNATNLLTTYEYSRESARSGTLTQTGGNPDASQGLPIDYAFQWSYGKAETFSLLVPNVYGGASGNLGPKSHLEAAIDREHLPAWEADQFYTAFNAYWGDQPDTAGPVYLGAVVCFLFLLAALYCTSAHKWWIISITGLAVLMAWGRHFGYFNEFLFQHLPLYNKFRAPSMILFIPQLTVPLLMSLGLQQLFYGTEPRAVIRKKFRLALGITGALLVGAVALYMAMNYQSARDRQRAQYLTQMNKLDPAFGTSLLQAASKDRQDLFRDDLVRSTCFIAGAALLLGLYLRRRLGTGYALAGLCMITVIDLMGVDVRYLGYHSYMNREDAGTSITPTSADLQIDKDPSYFRVLNLADGPGEAFQEANTSYFHNSLGGYHPAKLALIEDLIHFQLSKTPVNQAVLDMFNTKYVILPRPLSPIRFTESTGSSAQGPIVAENRSALGPCWFVESLRWVDSPAEAMQDLDHFSPADSALVERTFHAGIPFLPKHSPRARIQLVKNDNDVVTYTSLSPSAEFAVFSEIYYSKGWKATIDGADAPIVRVDYALRGLAVAPGHHTIVFTFRPQSFYLGEKIASISSWMMILLIGGTFGREWRRYLARSRKA